jgi:cytochrome c oxidase cbb3-type subunit 3
MQLRREIMTKRSSWLFVVFFFVFQNSGSVGAQDQADAKKLYAAYCSSCHGEQGKGDGVASKSLPVKVGDHTDGSFMNQLSDKFLFDIISKGGNAVDKSAMMPAWGNQLNEKQIGDLVAYIRSIANPPYKPPAK